MRIRTLTAIAVTFLAGTAFAMAGTQHATKPEAIAMVKKAVTAIKTEGVQKAYSEIDTKHGKFSHLDLYIVVYRLDGTVLAHGANHKLIGKNLIDAQDVDGVYFVKERVKFAREKGNFWQDYKFVNPVTKKIAPKEMYCQRLNDTAVCGGVYKS